MVTKNRGFRQRFANPCSVLASLFLWAGKRKEKGESQSHCQESQVYNQVRRTEREFKTGSEVRTIEQTSI